MAEEKNKRYLHAMLTRLDNDHRLPVDDSGSATISVDSGGHRSWCCVHWSRVRWHVGSRVHWNHLHTRIGRIGGTVIYSNHNPRWHGIRRGLGLHYWGGVRHRWLRLRLKLRLQLWLYRLDLWLRGVHLWLNGLHHLTLDGVWVSHVATARVDTDYSTTIIRVLVVAVLHGCRLGNKDAGF